VGKNALIKTNFIRISITFVKSQTFTKVNTRKISAKFKNEKKKIFKFIQVIRRRRRENIHKIKNDIVTTIFLLFSLLLFSVFLSSTQNNNHINKKTHFLLFFNLNMFDFQI